MLAYFYFSSVTIHIKPLISLGYNRDHYKIRLLTLQGDTQSYDTCSITAQKVAARQIHTGKKSYNERIPELCRRARNHAEDHARSVSKITASERFLVGNTPIQGQRNSTGLT